jgi:hypothetical protein
MLKVLFGAKDISTALRRLIWSGGFEHGLLTTMDVERLAQMDKESMKTSQTS